MNRIINPLRQMGAEISGVNGYAPLTVKPARAAWNSLRDAGRQRAGQERDFAGGAVRAGSDRDHAAGSGARSHRADADARWASICVTEGNTVTLVPGKPLKPMDFTVPGDASSAAFPVVAALIVPGSDITLTNINLNPTRTGLFDVLLEMGADLTITETGTEAGDPVGTIRARHSALKGVSVGGEVVVRMIDEFPIFMVAALFAEGTTTVRDAQELRVKETDRLAVMTAELTKLGARHHRN